MRLIVTVTALAALSASLLVTPAAGVPSVPAPHGKKCGITAKGSTEYRVKGRAVRCKFARKWVKRYLSKGTHARGFTCTETDGTADFFCTKGPKKAYWAEYL